MFLHLIFIKFNYVKKYFHLSCYNYRLLYGLYKLYVKCRNCCPR